MPKPQSLLEQAIATSNPRCNKAITDQERELAIAWAEGLVSHTQIGRVTKRHPSNIYNFLALALRDAIRVGDLSKNHRDNRTT